MIENVRKVIFQCARKTEVEYFSTFFELVNFNINSPLH